MSQLDEELVVEPVATRLRSIGRTGLNPRLTLHSLAPVRFCLHRMLTEQDAGRLLGVSCSTSIALLRGFTFHDHVFHWPTVEDAQRCKAVYERFGLRITRLCFSMDVPLVGEVSGQPLLPSSLLVFELGGLHQGRAWCTTSGPVAEGGRSNCASSARRARWDTASTRSLTRT